MYEPESMAAPLVTVKVVSPDANVPPSLIVVVVPDGVYAVTY